MSRIYIATKFEEGDRAQEVAQMLVGEGHSITHRWWGNDENNAEQACRDMWGVMTAEALVFIAEKDLPYSGSLVELGMMLAKGGPVYVMGPYIDKCIFMKLPQVYKGIDYLINPVPLYSYY